MDLSENIREALGQCRESVAQARTLPPAVYTDADAFRREQLTIFRQGWVGVGRSDRWSATGDFAAIDLGGVPTIVVRDKEGILRAFANSCSHRSAQVLEGEGNCTTMRCPFHAWTYALDGGLLGAPSMHRTPGFDKADHALPEFHTAEHDGFAFVSLEAAPPPLPKWLGDFSELHAPWPLADLVMSHRREFVVDCNWKTFSEVFNEYYHLPYVHPGSIDFTYNEPDDAEPVEGAYATHFGSTNGTGGVLEADLASALPAIGGLGDRELNGVRYSWIFPNIVVAFGSDALWMYETYPISADKTLCAQAVCFPPETIARDDFAAKAARYYERFDVAVAEDIPMLERQQRGLNSPFARQGPFSYLEPSVARFASWYADRMLTGT